MPKNDETPAPAWRFDPSRYEGRTEGEWVVDQTPAVREGDGSFWVSCAETGASIVGCGEWEHRASESYANARLIQDAPNLLAEVVRLREALRSIYDAAKTIPARNANVVEQARAALSQEGSDGE